MDPDKSTVPAIFDSNATTPTRMSVEHGRTPRVPSGDTLHEEKTNELRSIQSHQDAGANGNARDIEKEAAGISAAADDKRKPEKDPNLVEWDGPDDPENPQNWPTWKKWLITMTLSTMTVWITFASSVFSTATLATAEEFHVSTEVTTLGTSLVVFVSLISAPI